MNHPYLFSMIIRIITMLAILAITVVTTVSSAHATRLSISSGPDHAMHFGEMINAPDLAQLACEGEPNCGAATSELCEFICAGLSAFVMLRAGEDDPAAANASHDFPSGATQIGRAPGLSERPPKLRPL